MENPSASALCYREPRSSRAGQRKRAVGAGDRALATLLQLVGGKPFHGPKSAFSWAQIRAEKEPAKSATWHGPFLYQRHRALEQNQEMWFQVLLESSLSLGFPIFGVGQ